MGLSGEQHHFLHQVLGVDRQETGSMLALRYAGRESGIRHGIPLHWCLLLLWN